MNARLVESLPTVLPSHNIDPRSVGESEVGACVGAKGNEPRCGNNVPHDDVVFEGMLGYTPVRGDVVVVVLWCQA